MIDPNERDGIPNDSCEEIPTVVEVIEPAVIPAVPEFSDVPIFPTDDNVLGLFPTGTPTASAEGIPTPPKVTDPSVGVGVPNDSAVLIDLGNNIIALPSVYRGK